MAQAADALIGTELAGYRIESFLGRGGMSVVYLAEDLRLDRPVALKLLSARLAGDERFRERFHRESRLAASLDHPNVIPIYEAGQAGDQLYIAMRYVEGVDLGHLLAREGKLEPARCLALLGQTAEALDAAHARGLVHRDIKPGNILVAEGEHAYLSDFGLTKRSEASDSLTETGGLLGTVDYVAPEQIEGDAVDGRADVYSLACVLYECLAGQKPFPRDTDLAVLWAHVQDAPPPVSRRSPELAVGIDAVLARGLAKDPADRFDSAGELLTEARNALLEGVELREETSPAAPVRKLVTVVFASVEARSASGSQLDPESLGRATGRCLEELTAALQRHGGIVEPLAGHGTVAVFGHPVTREDDAIRATRAAEELRARLEHTSRELEQTIGLRVSARVGLETGEVVATKPGAGPDALVGETVNLAARLEGTAGPGEIVLGRGTHDLVGDRVVTEPIDGATAADGPVWRLMSMLPEPPLLGRRPHSPMIGRAGELAVLERAFEQAVETRTCQLVTVLGPAGIGKSRIANALAASVEGRATVLAGRCLSYGEGITYWPVGEIVRAIAAGGEPGAALRRLLGSEREGAAAADLVAAAVGLSEAMGGGEETFWAIRLLFETLARSRPLVVVLEDVHWAEPTLLDLIEHLARAARDAPLLLVCLARPDLLDARAAFQDVPGSVTLELEPLTKAESALIVERLHSAGELPPELAARIVEIAEGNPLFLEQFLAMASEDTAGSPRLTLPPATQALLAARLDRLPAEERELIECASIEGLVFHVGPLTELWRGADEAAVWRHLLALTRKELVRPDRSEVAGDEALRFQHALIREAAYQGIPKERRAELHEQYGSFLERTQGHAPTALELEEIVGYHLEQAVRYRWELGAARDSDRALADRASARLAAAGRRALARVDLPAAINLLERAAELLPAGGVERGLLEVDLGAALTGAGRLKDADALLSAVEQRSSADRRVAANATVQRLLARYSLDLEASVTALRHQGDELQQVLEKDNDDRGLYRLWQLRGLVHWAEGSVSRAEDAWKRGLVHARRAGDRRAEVDALCWLASGAFFGPTPARAGIERCEAILEDLRDQPHGRAQVLQPLAGLHAITGRFDVADALLREAQAIRAEVGVTMESAVSHPEVLVAQLKGDLSEAQTLLRDGYRRLEAMGEQGVLSITAALLSRVAYEGGELDEALSWATKARELAAGEDTAAQAIWRGVRARVLARRGGLDEAGLLATEAVALAERTDHSALIGDALLDLADVRDHAGRMAEAIGAARLALTHYESKGHEISAQKARALLDTAVRR